MFRAHSRSSLSWQTVGRRIIPFLIEGRQDSNPHFLFTAPSLSVTVLIYIYIIPQIREVVNRFSAFSFSFVALATAQINHNSCGSAPLPINTYIIPQICGVVKRFFNFFSLLSDDFFKES